jgi:hypothetical protein
LHVPEWKWEEIAMDFILGLARTQSYYDSIWVIVDRLSKVLYTCQGHLLQTATIRVVYVEDSLSAWSAEDDYV